MSKSDLQALRSALGTLIRLGVVTKDQAWDMVIGAVSEPDKATSTGKAGELSDAAKKRLNRAFAGCARTRTLVTVQTLKDLAHKQRVPVQHAIAYGLATKRLVKRAGGSGSMFYINDSKTAARRWLREQDLNGAELADKLGLHFTRGFELLKSIQQGAR